MNAYTLSEQVIAFLLGIGFALGMIFILYYGAERPFGFYKSVLRRQQGPERDDKPRHVAIVMDGNRRYGKKKHGSAMKGHWDGGQMLANMTEWCMAEGVEMLTVYAFSTENWNREATEVDTLMTIFVQYASSLQEEALKNDVRVRVICTDSSRLPEKVRTATKLLEDTTSNCSTFLVNICLSYGSRGEIVNATRSLAVEVAEGKRVPESIDEGIFSNYLSTADLPDPEILIRTSGEHRLSNFLLWQLAYTEIFFVDKLWPELTKDDLHDILDNYTKRVRRFGT